MLLSKLCNPGYRQNTFSLWWNSVHLKPHESWTFYTESWTTVLKFWLFLLKSLVWVINLFHPSFSSWKIETLDMDNWYGLRASWDTRSYEYILEFVTIVASQLVFTCCVDRRVVRQFLSGWVGFPAVIDGLQFQPLAGPVSLSPVDVE